MQINDFFKRSPKTSDEELFACHAEARIKNIETLISKYPNKLELVQVKNDFKQLDAEWKECIEHHGIKYGYRGNRILVQSILKYKLIDFIKEQYKFTYFGKNSKFMDFEFNCFASLAKMEVALLLMKYQNDLMEIEVEVAIAELFLNYFNLIDAGVNFDNAQWTWFPQPGDLTKCIEVVKNMDFIDIRPYLCRIDRYFKIDNGLQTATPFEEEKRKPTTKEDILKLYKEGMSPTEFNKEIMHYWNVCERTARRLRNKFGLMNNSAVETSEESKSESVENPVEDAALKTENDALKQELEALKQELEALKSTRSPEAFIQENKLLKEENGTLKLQLASAQAKIKNLEQQQQSNQSPQPFPTPSDFHFGGGDTKLF
jgi:hypothetical protein